MQFNGLVPRIHTHIHTYCIVYRVLYCMVCVWGDDVLLACIAVGVLDGFLFFLDLRPLDSGL